MEHLFWIYAVGDDARNAPLGTVKRFRWMPSRRPSLGMVFPWVKDFYPASTVQLTDQGAGEDLEEVEGESSDLE